MRNGIGQPPDGWDPAEYVLSKFSKNERLEIDAAIWRAADAVSIWVSDGAEACMDQHN
jgi:PTH1 family peptidyl-tRNA hydrolase